MRIIEDMILQQNYARMWAGKVVAEMIRRGADPVVMRVNGIPTGVFYGVLGGTYWRRWTVAECAEKMLDEYRPDFLYRYVGADHRLCR
jgi:hypothetical protein